LKVKAWDGNSIYAGITNTAIYNIKPFTQLHTFTPVHSGLLTKANYNNRFRTRHQFDPVKIPGRNVLKSETRQGVTLTADRLTNRLNRRLMASLSHGRNTMKTDSQQYKGRSSMLCANRIACIPCQDVDEHGAIVLGPMTETQNHDGQVWLVTKPFPSTVPIKAGSTL
jgi:hypothetical protein